MTKGAPLFFPAFAGFPKISSVARPLRHVFRLPPISRPPPHFSLHVFFPQLCADPNPFSLQQQEREPFFCVQVIPFLFLTWALPDPMNTCSLSMKDVATWSNDLLLARRDEHPVEYVSSRLPSPLIEEEIGLSPPSSVPLFWTPLSCQLSPIFPPIGIANSHFTLPQVQGLYCRTATNSLSFHAFFPSSIGKTNVPPPRVPFDVLVPP